MLNTQGKAISNHFVNPVVDTDAPNATCPESRFALSVDVTAARYRRKRNGDLRPSETHFAYFLGSSPFFITG